MELGPLPSQPKSASATPPLVPTPPAEVFVRTLESDVQSLRASGGMKPKPERIVLSKPAEEGIPKVSWFASKNVEVKWLFIAGGAIVALGALLIYGFIRFSLPFPVGGGVPAALPVPATEEPGFLPAVPSSSVSASTTPAKGIFRKPADRSVSFVAAQVAQNIAELKTPVQRLREALAALPGVSTSSLIEVIPTDVREVPVPLTEYFSLLDLDVFSPGFLAAHFEDRFAMFAYRDKKGWWPGYILALRPGENWLFLKDEMKALEESANIENFFLVPPGSPKSDFMDVRVGDAPAREILWSDGRFLYGWFRGYLVLSTSKEGLEAALPRL